MVLIVRADENSHRGVVVGRGAVLGDDMAHRMPVRAEGCAAEAPVSMLLERIAAEESARAEGEKLEEQRFEAERQSDRIARR